MSNRISQVSDLYDRVMRNGFDLTNRKDFWHLVSQAKIEFNQVPSPIADMLGELRCIMVKSKRWPFVRTFFLWFILPIFLGIISILVWFIIGRFGEIYSLSESFSRDYLIVNLGLLKLFLWGFGWTLVTDRSHTVAHVIIGSLFRIKFRSMISARWMNSRIPVILEMDYKTYLKTSFVKREIMHISGTIVPFFIVVIWFLITDAWFRFIMPLFILGFFIIVVRKGYANDMKYFMSEREYSKKHKEFKQSFAA
ncbi:hypothetical protein [[Eubacterium] cellulosolvens]